MMGHRARYHEVCDSNTDALLALDKRRNHGHRVQPSRHLVWSPHCNFNSADCPLTYQMQTCIPYAAQVLGTGDPYLHPRITLGGLEPMISTILRSRRILLISCGTSYHACLAMRPLLESLGGVAVSLDLASDFIDRKAPVFRDDTVICLSQSGETADTLAALRYAKGLGGLCIGVTNAAGSSLSRETECGVHLNAGYEMGVASTKAYTSQLVVLVMIALLLARDSIDKRELRDSIADELLHLPERVRRALQLDGRVKELAETLKDEGNLMAFGRGYNYATALEAALKACTHLWSSQRCLPC
jgi:glutamine---fructose-6-phosphate transaminase (isomerizing)